MPHPRSMLMTIPRNEPVDEIVIRTPREAIDSTNYLNLEWAHATLREEKETLLNYALQVYIKSKSLLANKELTPRERKKLQEVMQIYKNWIQLHKLRR